MKKTLILFLIAVIFLTSGCYSLRKKFVRKKKYQKEEPVYVNFKDYPTKPSREAYVNYYIFIKGWLDELMDSLSRTDVVASLKREKRAINGIVKNLEQMISFYNQKGKEKAYPLYQDIVQIRKEIEDDPAMNNTDKTELVKRLEHFRRKFEAEFNYRDAEKWMD